MINEIFQHKKYKSLNIKILSTKGLFAEFKNIGRDNRDSITIEKLLSDYNMWS